MTAEDRILRLENAFVTLTDLAENIDRRLDTHDTWINRLGEAQAHTEARIAALTDAQIRTEDALARLAVAQREQDARITTLVDSQLRTEEITRRNSEAIERNSESISQLAEIVRQLATRQNGDGTSGA